MLARSPGPGDAPTLVISERTAETHVEHILAKLGFTRRIQVATWVGHRQLDPEQ